jgi:basic amino acid/polyamine antiporter, APA family
MMFCYIGFDTVCNLTGDAKRPADLKIAVVGTVGVATLLYAAVALVLTGMVPYGSLISGTSLASAFEQVGLSRMGHIVRILAFMMMLATLLACLMGQPKLFQMMAKDGFLPALFDQTTSKGVPRTNILLSGTISALAALFIKKDDIVDLTALGGLVTFSLNAAGLLMTRLRLHPTTNFYGSIFLAWLLLGSVITFSLFHANIIIGFYATLPFLTAIPAMLLILISYYYKAEILQAGPISNFHWTILPLIPIASIIGNSVVLPTLPFNVFVAYFVWLLLGIILYYCYGYSHSLLRRNLHDHNNASDSRTGISLNSKPNSSTC